MIGMTSKNLDASEFVLLISDNDKIEFDNMSKKFNSVIDIVGEYNIEVDNVKYWLVQLEAMFENRSADELCKFVYDYFPFVAMHQSGSTFILVSDEEEFKLMYKTIYGENKVAKFFYDMLSIEDRYYASCNTDIEIDPHADNRLISKINGAIYSFVFGKDCVHLFNNEYKIQVVDEEAGKMKNIDITDGLGIFDFHLAILN